MSVLQNLMSGKTLSDAEAAAEKTLADLAAAIKNAAASTPPPLAPVDAVEYDGDFNPAVYSWKPDRVYRIHFKNGFSGEYNGAVLAHTFSFDAAQVSRVEAQ